MFFTFALGSFDKSSAKFISGFWGIMICGFEEGVEVTVLAALIKEAALFSGDITSAFLLRALLLLDVLLLFTIFLEIAFRAAGFSKEALPLTFFLLPS